jgi:transcriptional regulator with XRE-family HTH domain
LSGSDRARKASAVGHLIAVVDEYKDRTGQPSDASISRAIGVARQTVSNWRTRGIKELPEFATLRKLANLVGRDYETVVLRAALLDAGWIEESERAGADESAGETA